MSAIGQQLIEIVRAKAAENPDFIYSPPGGEDASCVYVHEGRPSCLIGHALWECGLIDGDFERRVGDNKQGFDDIAPMLGLELGQDELAWLLGTQGAQDNSRPWGAAVRRADQAVRGALA